MSINSLECPIINQHQESFTVLTTPRNGSNKPLAVVIGKINDLKLTEDSFSKVCGIINKQTASKPYQYKRRWATLKFEGKKYVINRYNHNGTHSARQAKFVDAIFNLIQSKGSIQSKKMLQSLTSEEKIALKLGAYCARIGRSDESSHKSLKPDDYYSRSAQIFHIYADQLGVSKEVNNWVSSLIINSCKPQGIRDKEIDTNPKNLFGYQVLTMAHELDLVRCFPRKKFDNYNKVAIDQRIQWFIEPKSKHLSPKITNQFVNFSILLTRITGGHLRYRFPNARIFTNESEYVKCSIQGEYCMDKLQRIRLPKWGKAQRRLQARL